MVSFNAAPAMSEAILSLGLSVSSEGFPVLRARR
jgi:hypothetical protein